MRKSSLAGAAPVVLGLAAVGIFLAAAQVARADVAPFPAQTGTSLGAAAPTDIKMISETVVLAVTDIVVTNGSGLSYTQTGAIVTADFLLNNPEGSAQSLQVGFPLDVPAQSQDAGGYLKLTNLRAFVSGQEMTTQLQTVGNDTWSAWQMSFAPGETHVRVTYELPATVDACNTELGYVIHTGAAWAGSIGQADLIVRYPYAAEATFVSPHGIYLGNSTPGFKVEGTDLHWHYANLEPTPANDLAVTFVTPDCWLAVAAARSAVNQKASAENYWRLANAYADIVFPHHGFYSPLIAQVAQAQYQKALALDPQNPQINADYAMYLYYQYDLGGGGLLPSDTASEVSQQCLKALVLKPGDDNLNATCGDFLSQYSDPNASDSDQATVAAVLTVAAQAPSEQVATDTAQPAASPSPTAQPTAPASPAPSASPTALPTVAPTATAAPTRSATATPMEVAQVTAATLPPTAAATPTPQTNAALPLAALGLGVVVLGVIVLGLIVAGAYFWRRGKS